MFPSDATTTKGVIAGHPPEPVSGAVASADQPTLAAAPMYASTTRRVEQGAPLLPGFSRRKVLRVSVSFIRTIAASPKKVLTTAAVAAAATGMVLAASPAQAATGQASSAQAIAHKMIPDAAQFTAFSKIVEHESGWNPSATNSASGAYGLVQALPV